ncbi:hypothetical protein I8J29_14155 [Paenibacillus sp. MWE-103]|uniref:Uncharacterized protein n=1 Tax=Paenibacillus artemisiicola TaxID=1172618 RepID=A0ABS3WAK1_9BACL|nr:hypothetical protein [Paenibacillus artemisiicola]MBO7745351.1 hypothetical protein [Paenibacillus artemisiicola]
MNGRGPVDMQELFSFLGRAGEQEPLVELGVASERLRRAFAAHEERREALEAELQEASVNALVAIRRQYSARVQTLQEEHDAIWREIKDSLGLPRDMKLAMDPGTGKIAGRGGRRPSAPAEVIPFPGLLGRP